MQHAAHAAQLLAAAGPSRAAVHEHGQRRAVLGRLGGVVAVQDEQPAVPRGQAENHLAGEGRLYDFTRADNRSPNILTSMDEGSTWTYAGKLTETPTNVGYVNGYFKYASNGVDRIDFVGTEHHPHDYDTSIYHGVVRGGMTFQSDGVTVEFADESLFVG